MKLRNKKTGEILESARSSAVIKDKFRIYDELNDKYYTYNSLAELNAEWEDYEEPKEFWFVDSGGEVEEATYLTDNDKSKLRNFGNYFETKEEAEKAVEKLKAWKRLKDKGFKFRKLRRYLLTDGGLDIRLSKSEYWKDEQVQADLDLLFGGEE